MARKFVRPILERLTLIGRRLGAEADALASGSGVLAPTAAVVLPVVGAVVIAPATIVEDGSVVLGPVAVLRIRPAAIAA